MCIFPPAQTIVSYYKLYVPVCALSLAFSFSSPPLPPFFSVFLAFFYYCFIISQWYSCSEDLCIWIGLFLMDAADWH